MADFPYTPVASKLKQFFTHISEASIPERVTQPYLAKAGFKSTNDRTFLPVLKALGFLDTSGKPTQLWTDYRNREISARVLAGAIRSAYQPLFAMYEDADRKDVEALRNFFAHGTTVGSVTVGRMVETFRALCKLADFEGTPIAPSVPTPTPPAGSETAPPFRRQAASGGLSLPAININIQLELPATDNAEIYDKLFAAMKKHLLSS